MIVRRIARPLLAAIFISGGINALREPQGHAQVAGPFLDKTIGERADMLPEAVPTDAETLVKINAGVKIAAGSSLALGKCPRLASGLLLGTLVPTTAAGHPFWEKNDPGERAEQLTQFLKNAGLAGGLLLAAADTEGKPSLGWRARKAAKQAGKQVEGAGGTVQGNVRGARRTSKRVARRAKKNVSAVRSR